MLSKLLLVDDEPDVRYCFGRVFDSANLELTAAASGEEALSLIPQVRPDLVLMDVRLGGLNGLETLRRMRRVDPQLLIILMSAYGTTQAAIKAMKLGAYDFLLKPFDILKLKETVQRGIRASAEIKRAALGPRPTLSGRSDSPLVGRAEGIQAVFKLIGQVANSDATVLITGESGTGKELVAHAIYEHSRRSKQPFLAVNCAAIPEQLLESELFGHEQGSFTGAAQRRFGKFEQCSHGTLFLDEIGDMAPATQTKILRVLQSGTFERVGGNQTVQADVRIIAATNKSLEQLLASGQFRKDLFYRLNVVRVHLPPLRDRREDISLLVDDFLNKPASQQRHPTKFITPEALQALRNYDWPGNVRELQNAIHRAVVLSKGQAILKQDLPREITGFLKGAGNGSNPSANCPPLAISNVTNVAREIFAWARNQSDCGLIGVVFKELIFRALQETRGNQIRAARLLGITRSSLRSKMKSLELGKAPVCFDRSTRWAALSPA